MAQTVRSAAALLKEVEPYDPKYIKADIYLNANENPYGVPNTVVDDIVNGITSLDMNRYPNPLADELREDLATYHGVSTSNVILGNGGDELLFDIMLAYGGRGRKMLTCNPAFSVYNGYAQITSTEVVDIPRDGHGRIDEDAVIGRVSQGDIDIVMLASPNNPTGDCLAPGFWQKLLDASDALILADQAYIEFADKQYDVLPMLRDNANLAILRTFSKAFALAGIRLGYLLCNPAVITELCKVRQPYSVDKVSAIAGSAALAHADDMREAVSRILPERERFLRAHPDAYDSEANFVYWPMDDPHGVWQRLYDEYGILVREFPGGLRITIGTTKEMERLEGALETIMGGDA
jgi:histidinol-phosphate aminotransferase